MELSGVTFQSLDSIDVNAFDFILTREMLESDEWDDDDKRVVRLMLEALNDAESSIEYCHEHYIAAVTKLHDNGRIDVSILPKEVIPKEATVQ